MTTYRPWIALSDQMADPIVPLSRPSARRSNRKRQLSNSELGRLGGVMSVIFCLGFLSFFAAAGLAPLLMRLVN